MINLAWEARRLDKPNLNVSDIHVWAFPLSADGKSLDRWIRTPSLLDQERGLFESSRHRPSDPPTQLRGHNRSRRRPIDFRARPYRNLDELAASRSRSGGRIHRCDSRS